MGGEIMVVVSAMSKDELYAWVVDLLSEMFELDKETLTLQSNLYADLDIDSIDAVDLAVKLKQMTGKRLQPEVFKKIRTIGDVVDAFSVRIVHGYPIYHLEYEAQRQALLQEVHRIPNLRTAGRQGLFRYVFMDAAMQMGTLAAEQLRTGEGALSARKIDAIGRSTRVVETTALTA